MKDSRIGTYGVLALVLALILRWAALSALLATGHVWGALIGVAALSRAPMAALMGWLPSARPSGLSRSVGQPTRDTVRFGFIAAGAVGFVFMGLAVVPVAAFIAAVAFAAGRIALDKIGGQTGDILGATQQLSEITALAVLVALWV
jgi:adenosylcobinamide-GDP ribazoletransferase